MNQTPVPHPLVQEPAQGSDARLRDVAYRRWVSQQKQERQIEQRRGAARLIDQVARLRRLRTARQATTSLSPVYSMFSEAFYRGR